MKGSKDLKEAEERIRELIEEKKDKEDSDD